MHLYKRLCLSVHPSLGLFVGPYMLFLNDEGEKSSNDIINDVTISHNEVVAADAPFVLLVDCKVY